MDCTVTLKKCQVSRFRRETPTPTKGLPYGRTYLPFSSFTYCASGGDRHTHPVLLLDRQAHHCLLIYAFLVQMCDA